MTTSEGSYDVLLEHDRIRVSTFRQILPDSIKFHGEKFGNLKKIYEAHFLKTAVLSTILNWSLSTD